MVIDILEIERVCNKYKGPLQVDIQFDQYGLTIRAYIADDESFYSTNRRFTYDQIQMINMSLEALVENVVDKFYTGDLISKAMKKQTAYDVPMDETKAWWLYFGDFTNGKGFRCSKCRHIVYVLDGGYPSEEKCPNCGREMGCVHYKEVTFN